MLLWVGFWNMASPSLCEKKMCGCELFDCLTFMCVEFLPMSHKKEFSKFEIEFKCETHNLGCDSWMAFFLGLIEVLLVH